MDTTQDVRKIGSTETTTARKGEYNGYKKMKATTTLLKCKTCDDVIENTTEQNLSVGDVCPTCKSNPKTQHRMFCDWYTAEYLIRNGYGCTLEPFDEDDN